MVCFAQASQMSYEAKCDELRNTIDTLRERKKDIKTKMASLEGNIKEGYGFVLSRLGEQVYEPGFAGEINIDFLKKALEGQEIKDKPLRAYMRSLLRLINNYYFLAERLELNDKYLVKFGGRYIDASCSTTN